MQTFKAHAYQEVAIDWILNKPKCGLFLDMGLGKTVITLTALDELIYNRFDVVSGRVLVIAPLRVAESTWSNEVAKWEHLSHLQISRILGTQKQRIAALNKQADIYVINRENVKWLVDYLADDWKFECVVIDELSSFKNPSSQRFKALRKVSGRLTRVIGLTGTPAPRSLLDLWPQIYLLDRGKRLGLTMGRYKAKYFRPGRHNGYVIYEWLANEGSDEAIHNAIKDICVSLTANDYLNMPPRIDNRIEITLSPSVRKAYNDFEREKLLELEKGEIVASSAGVLANKLTQFTNGAVYDDMKIYREVHDYKLDALESVIEEANGQPVMVVYTFKHDLIRITERLKNYDLRMIKGDQDIQDWNDGKIQVLLCHPASMGHGLNLQKGGHILVWFGLTWDLELYQQTNARLYRQGQTKPVIIHHIVCKDTIDEDILDRLAKKDINQQGLIDAVKARITP